MYKRTKAKDRNISVASFGARILFVKERRRQFMCKFPNHVIHRPFLQYLDCDPLIRKVRIAFPALRTHPKMAERLSCIQNPLEHWENGLPKIKMITVSC